MRRARFILGAALAAIGYISLFVEVISTIDPLMWHWKFYTIEYVSLGLVIIGCWLALANRKENDPGSK